MVSFNKEEGAYQIDYTAFNSTRAVETPLCSMAVLDEFLRQQRANSSELDYSRATAVTLRLCRACR